MRWFASAWRCDIACRWSMHELWGWVLVRSWGGGRGGTNWGDREGGSQGGREGERDGGRHGKREAETEEDTEGDWARSKLATRVLVRKAWEGGSPFYVILLSMLPRGGVSAPSGRRLGSNIT